MIAIAFTITPPIDHRTKMAISAVAHQVARVSITARDIARKTRQAMVLVMARLRLWTNSVTRSF